MLRFFKSLLIGLGSKLPSGVRNSLFHFAYSCAPDEFVKFTYECGNGDQSYAMARIAARGFSPKTVVDVGAYHGHWSEMVRSIWPKCQIDMVEPNSEHTEILQSVSKKINATLHTELLGAKDGEEVTFYVMGTGSSVLSETSSVPRQAQTRRLRTLNAIFGDGRQVDLLKIDAQGYELQILAGADKILPNVQAVILEISLLEINKGAPILHEVMSYMRERGFVSYDVLEMHRRPLDGALFQLDMFFCRENSALRTDKRFM